MTNGGHKRSRTATVSEVVLLFGATRFEVVLWLTQADGTRKQARRRFVTERAAKAWFG